MKRLAAVFALASSVFGFGPQWKVNKPSKVSTTTLNGEYGVSSTSFYTTAEKKESYESLEEILQAKCKDEKVRGVIVDMLEACAEITGEPSLFLPHP